MLTPEGQTLVVAQDLSDAVEVLDVALITRIEIEAS
jgi:SpoU rRNA methylase family enzyme